MSSIPLYKAFIEVGASEQGATRAAEDVIQVSQLPQLATKADLADLKNEIASLETRLLKWVVGCGFLFAGIIITSVIAGVGIVIQIMLTPGVTQ